jgi:glycosyltransferase involved in cell wall biosynthesis
MGYRAYHIFKDAQIDITVFARSNLSHIKQRNIKSPFLGYRFFSRLAKLLRIVNQNWTFLQDYEAKLFDFFAKKEIDNHDTIHFFHHSSSLISYAKSQDKRVILEAFTHPLYQEYLFSQTNLKYDYDEFVANKNSIKCYELADMIISPSSWVTSTLGFANISENKIVQIEYGVNKHNQNQTKNLDKDIKFMFAGGVKRTKGILELLEAFDTLNKSYPLIELHIYGRIYSELNDELVKYQNNSNIIFHGFSTDMINEYPKYDVYVFPSYFEGSSKTIFEAMSFGLPVICTPNSGSIVRDEIDGYIIEAGQSDSLKDKMKSLIEDRELLNDLSNSAYEYVQGYSWERYGSKVLIQYNEIK